MAIDYANIDSQIDERANQLRNEAETQEFDRSVGNRSPFGGSSLGPGYEFLKKLPKNMGIGAMRAAYNTIETADEFVAETPLGKLHAELSKITHGRDNVEMTPLRQTYNGLFESADQFFNEVEEKNNAGDTLTQGMAQFIIPFTGYLKALNATQNGSKMLKVANLALAEGMTAATAFEAHEGRVADLVDMGRQMENEFGKTLSKMSPDDSALNAYINWMTDRENEGEWEGRFKNAVDSVATTVGVAGLFKGSAMAIRQAKQTTAELAKITKASLSKPKPKLTVGETGDHSLTVKGVGEASAQEGDGVLQMKRIDVNEEMRGTGQGMQMLERLVQEADSKGLKFVSDVTVSPSAARLYEGLERRGYKIKRNPTKVNPNTGSLISKDPKVPVFEVELLPEGPARNVAVVGTGAVATAAVVKDNESRNK